MTTSQLSASDDHVVSIHYRLTNDAGDLLDESGSQPVDYLHGHLNIVPGLEEQLAGKPVGFRSEVTVAPEKGYGRRDERGVQSVPRHAFPEGVEVVPGMQVMAQDAEGNPVPLRVTEVGEAEVTVDMNHPLAGVTLHFAVEVVGVRAATAEEIERGHLRRGGCEGGGCGGGGCGGHGHGEGSHGRREHAEGGCCGGSEHAEGGCCGRHQHA